MILTIFTGFFGAGLVVSGIILVGLFCLWKEGERYDDDFDDDVNF